MRKVERMETVTVSHRYQVAIPRKIRESLGLRAGQKMQMILHDGSIVLLPLRSMRKMRGFLKGIDTTVEREMDRV
jgi:AbrB family looped-hinge helix DNA binding protein